MEGAWDPLSLVEGMVHPHSQERDRMNHLLQSDQAFIQVRVVLTLVKPGQTRSSFRPFNVTTHTSTITFSFRKNKTSSLIF